MRSMLIALGTLIALVDCGCTSASRKMAEDDEILHEKSSLIQSDESRSGDSWGSDFSMGDTGRPVQKESDFFSQFSDSRTRSINRNLGIE